MIRHRKRKPKKQKNMKKCGRKRDAKNVPRKAFARDVLKDPPPKDLKPATNAGYARADSERSVTEPPQIAHRAFSLMA